VFNGLDFQWKKLPLSKLLLTIYYLSKASNPYQIKPINTTQYRKTILKGEMVPDWFVRKAVQELIFSELIKGEQFTS